MILNTIQFHYSNNWVKVNNQKSIIYNFIATFFWLVNQESDLGHCLHIKCQTTAIFTFIGLGTDGNYVALNASNLRYLTFNGHVKYHKINNLRNFLMKGKISKNANFAQYKC